MLSVVSRRGGLSLRKARRSASAVSRTASRSSANGRAPSRESRLERSGGAGSGSWRFMANRPTLAHEYRARTSDALGSVGRRWLTWTTFEQRERYGGLGEPNLRGVPSSSGQ